MRYFVAILAMIGFMAAFAPDARAQAVAPCPDGSFPKPGCDCSFVDVQRTHSEAMQVRDDAVTKQVIPKPDSTMALTCFDEAMTESAKAGDIFSDPTLPPLVLPNLLVSMGRLGEYVPNGVFFPPKGTMGIGGGLMSAINSVVSDALSGLLDNFLGSFAGPITSLLSGYIMGALQGILGPMLGFLSGIIMKAWTMIQSFVCNNMQDIWDNFAVMQGKANLTPFFTFAELFSNTVGGIGAVGTDPFASVLQANLPILNAANTDYLDLSNPVAASARWPWFKLSPNLVGANVAAVIGAM